LATGFGLQKRVDGILRDVSQQTSPLRCSDPQAQRLVAVVARSDRGSILHSTRNIPPGAQVLFLVGQFGEQKSAGFVVSLSIQARGEILDGSQKYRLEQPSEWPARILD
jgi:hypothetical protein